MSRLLEDLRFDLIQVVPQWILAIQHADESCRKSALCKASKIAADTESELPRDISLLLSNAAGAYLDYTGRKKGEFIKVVECCTQTEESLFKKCMKRDSSNSIGDERLYSPPASLSAGSAKYTDAAKCSVEDL
ncbi:hypothetical protein RvY_13565 [Ramazzottius varieornatus]|uniref:Uncharacterized protein n=1 Tax=Ramazzottius varieornatus TaxID=947166 RepID=A0A1D1VVS0_RAMVA|nr:hypothetical protein RvY_13565 [Ramazzottius varieornatus]